MHIFTMLVSWKQIETILLPNIQKARKEISFAKKVPRDHLNDVTSKDAKPATTSDNVYEQPDAYNVIRDVTFRLDLPIHKCTTEQSTLNTLKYLFFHMKCGIYVMIRNGDVRWDRALCFLSAGCTPWALLVSRSNLAHTSILLFS